jgi:hypothetical protein
MVTCRELKEIAPLGLTARMALVWVLVDYHGLNPILRRGSPLAAQTGVLRDSLSVPWDA